MAGDPVTGDPAAGDPRTARPVLVVRGLRISFLDGDREVRAVDGLDLEVRDGEILALVGESGCGKTVTALGILGLVPAPGRVLAGTVEFLGTPLRTLGEDEMRRLRGARIGMVFQDPGAALDPVLTIGSQIVETLRAHLPISRRDARRRAIELLESVSMPSPELRVDAYPHQLSTGLKQRAVIAMALACGPRLLIADEPTTSLDVTVQAQILDLLRDLRRRAGLSILCITHDLGVVAEIADRVVIAYAGRAVEEGPVREIFDRPAHPYTKALFEARRRTVEPDGLAPGAPPRMRPAAEGCPFQPGCPLRVDACAEGRPPVVEAGPDHRAACIRVEGA